MDVTDQPAFQFHRSETKMSHYVKERRLGSVLWPSNPKSHLRVSQDARLRYASFRLLSADAAEDEAFGTRGVLGVEGEASHGTIRPLSALLSRSASRPPLHVSSAES